MSTKEGVEQEMNAKSLFEKLLDNPCRLVEASYNEAFELNTEQLDAVYLRGIQNRFDALRESVPVLSRLAKEQGIEKIETLDDAVPLLFPHTVYKSYPLSLLERGQMDRLTRWLDGLTNYDLGNLDCTGVDTIDTWIRCLDEQTDLRVLHTFGTTGKLSFMPRRAEHWELSTRLTAHCIRDWSGEDSGPDLLTARLPMVQPGYRHGAGARRG